MDDVHEARGAVVSVPGGFVRTPIIGHLPHISFDSDSRPVYPGYNRPAAPDVRSSTVTVFEDG